MLIKLITGKSPVNYYLCVGKYSQKYLHFPVKTNYPIAFLGLFSILNHIYVGGSTAIYKKVVIHLNIRDKETLYIIAISKGFFYLI